ncbi:MAG: 30S ribosomal protein S12 methylthiotransferase RimO [Verrucomicrobiota bacterium]|jgi:ribosomal protein S12 methylthiotransferase
MTKPSHRPVRVGLISLGCAKNLVDAEIMLGSLLQSGMEITNEADQADVVIVNTCSFIEAAQKESVEAILESAQARAQTHPAQGLIVAGCLPQRFRDDLPKLLPEVDAFMGVDQVARASEIVRQALAGRREKLRRAGPGASGGDSARTIAKRLAGLEAKSPAPADGPVLQVHRRPSYIPDFATPRFRLTPRHFAYVKIAEGCNHPCSFCIIPQMRGAHRSRPQADVVREAAQLLAGGVRELNLISQDSTYYGLDLRPNHSRAISSPAKFSAAARALPAEATTLGTLLRALNALPGEFWVRLLYTHPAHWTGELIETIARCAKVARYVDLPLQHIHENMLERMRRETSRQHIVDLIARIRAGIPGIAIRTTFIVGFPGETEACFQSLLEFIRTAKFERLGVFTYSPQEGTRAGKMEGQIPERVRKQRQKLAMAEQLKVAREIAATFVGRELTVLIEAEARPGDLQAAKVSSWEHGLIRSSSAPAALQNPGPGGRGRFLIARSQADAPDIDGRVYVRGKLPLGQFARVKIIGHTDYDLIAEPAG